MAYYLLTRQVVFEAGSALQAVARHVSDAPVPPSQRGGATVPPDLERLVLALLAKRPEDRPASAAELARALAELELEPWHEAAAAEWWSTVRPLC